MFGAAVLSLLSSISLGLRPGPTIRLLGVGSPEDPFYLWLSAVLFACMGIAYLLASSDVRRFSPMIALAIGAHLGLALAFFAAAQSPGNVNLVRLSGAELLIGLSLLLFWWPIRS